MHRTQTDYENHLSFKLFLFSVVNFFAQPFYIAFFKGKFEGTPMDPKYFLGMRLEFVRMGARHSIHVIGSIFSAEEAVFMSSPYSSG